METIYIQLCNIVRSQWYIMFGAFILNAACLHFEISFCPHPAVHYMNDYLGFCELLVQFYSKFTLCVGGI